MRSVVLLSVFLAGVGGAADPAVAEEPAPQPSAIECPICHYATDKASYGQKAGSTMIRGATNLMFGWTELLLKPREEIQEGGNVVTGIGKGMSLAVGRTANGLGELLTFWTPKGRQGYLRFSKDCPICMGKHKPLSP